jgi:hypothetical protein
MSSLPVTGPERFFISKAAQRLFPAGKLEPARYLFRN